jgi:hypothetical protein
MQSANEGQSLFTKKGLRHASQNTSLPLQIKVSFVINGPTQTNHKKIQQPQFTQNPNKTYKQTPCKKKKKNHTREKNNLANKLKGKKNYLYEMQWLLL